MVRSKVIELGEFAFFEDEPLLILFNNQAPEGLREVCVIHEFEDELNGDLLKKGSKVLFGQEEYTVKEIGKVANKTLEELGHASFYFDLPDDQELLPGSVLLSPKNVPDIKEGDVIEFIF